MGKRLAALWVQTEVALTSVLSKTHRLEPQIKFVGKVRKQQSPVILFSDSWQAAILGISEVGVVYEASCL